MSAVITDADREVAHELAQGLCPRSRWTINIEHAPRCIDIAQAFADARAAFRRQVAAYLLDRGDQYDTSNGRWVPLHDAATALMNGEFDEAVAHGELEGAELLTRVDACAARRSR